MRPNYYRFMITKFESFDDDNCEEKLIKLRSDLTLIEALQMLLDFACQHPDGHFNDRGSVEIETEDATLSAIIEEDD